MTADRRTPRGAITLAEEGFTLIELMVVVLIIGILMSIALPTFLGARQRADARAAQSGARNALIAAKISYTDLDSYNNLTPAATGITTLNGIEPSLTYQAGASTGPTVVSFAVGQNGAITQQEVGLAALANTGTCYLLRDVQNIGGADPPGTSYGSTIPGNCTGAFALANATANSW